MAFPLSPVPSQFKNATWGLSTTKKAGVHYVGDSVIITFTAANAATAYSVRDYDNNVISSGSLTPSSTTIALATPSGGWKKGWYRVFFTGPINDSVFGFSYGVTNFGFINSNSNFIPMPPGNTASYGGGSSTLALLEKGVLGIGHTRLSVSDTLVLTNTADNFAAAQANMNVAATYWTNPGSQYLDPVRTRYYHLAFPNGTADAIAFTSNAGANSWLNLYVKDPSINGANVYASISAGTSSGKKLTIYSPNNTTVVETYDNFAANNNGGMAAAINTGSAYVKAFSQQNGTVADDRAVVAIGSTRKTNIATVVADMYTRGCTRFEGPYNEPLLNAEIAHQMRLFQDAVHTGNASAVAIGPMPVDITNLPAWENFLIAGGGNYCDEISFHDYNSITNGEMNIGRSTIENFIALLTKYGVQNKVMWQTEATNVFTAVYGVHHPKRSRVMMMMVLLWEQYGIPRERNPQWYDVSHGFWSFPSFLQHGDGSLNPYAFMYRTLAEETWAQTHSQRLRFGPVGDRIFLGSLYSGSAGKTVVLMSESYMPNSTITLYLTGVTGTVTVVDAWGNTSSQTISNGYVTIPVTEIPTYVRLPVGATVSVYSCNDWPPISKGQGYSVALNTRSTLTDLPVSELTDNGFMTYYASQFPRGEGKIGSYATLPNTATLMFENAAKVDRVVIFNGPAWQSLSCLLDFDVQTTINGTTWVTQNTVDNTADATTFLHGANSTNTGTQLETFWKEQYIFDVKFPASMIVKGVRLYVRATSYGGEPNAAAVAAGGQGDATQRLSFQEIVPLSDSIDTYVRA